VFITNNMSLVTWDLPEDPWDYQQLASNFVAVDEHDHVPGRGKQIPSGGILDQAVTAIKIAPNAVVPTQHIAPASIPLSRMAPGSVGASQLVSGSVGSGALAPGAVTLDRLDTGVLPIGFVGQWYRATTAITPPTNWEIMDGRDWASIPNKMGPGGTQWSSGTIPDMRNRFALGASVVGVGTSPLDPPDIGSRGGSMTRNLSHTHTLNQHSHSVSPHSHSITADGSHNHRYTSYDGHQVDAMEHRVAAAGSGRSNWAVFVPFADALGTDPHPVTLTTQASHNHTGATASSTATTDLSPAGDSTQAAGDSNADLRPAFVGLLYIMRVR
jgi:hypothetical protein